MSEYLETQAIEVSPRDLLDALVSTGLRLELDPEEVAAEAYWAMIRTIATAPRV